MPQFADQLIAARKAKAMTQEQLAQAVHISRSRVSRWETGDAVPDLDMIRQLSEVLEVDFLASPEKEEPVLADVPAPAEESPAHEAPAAQEPAAEPDAQPAESPKPAAKKRWLPAVIGGAAVLAVVLMLLLLPGKKAPTPVEVYEPFTLEWYQQEIAPVENLAHVTIVPGSSPTKAVRFEEFAGGVGWFYSFDCSEVNGVPFTVTKITQTVFSARGQDHMEFTGDEVIGIMGDTTLTKEQAFPFTWTGGFPLQSVSGVGLALEGVDANGHELIFRGYVELSQEIEE